MESKKHVENVMKCAMDGIHNMIDADTVIGDPIYTKDGTCIIPVSKATFGFVSGGSEFGTPVENADLPFGGGAGSGVSLRPVTFLIIKDGTVSMLPIDHVNPTDRLVDSIPVIINSIKDFISGLTSKKDDSADTDTSEDSSSAEGTSNKKRKKFFKNKTESDIEELAEEALEKIKEEKEELSPEE